MQHSEICVEHNITGHRDKYLTWITTCAGSNVATVLVSGELDYESQKCCFAIAYQKHDFKVHYFYFFKFVKMFYSASVIEP